MGGTVAMIVRKPEGHEPEVQPMLRWTNPLPYHLAKPSFISGDFDRWWPDFIKPWEEQKQDQQEDKVGLKAPYGYGLILVDFQSKTVLHSQGYCSFGSEALFRWNDLEPEELADLRRKHQAGMIPNLVMRCLDESKSGAEKTVRVPLHTQDLGMKGLDRLMELGCNAYSPEAPTTLDAACGLLGVPLPAGFDPELTTRVFNWEMPYASEWKFERFEETAPGFAQLRQRAEAIGFVFTPEDDKAWYEWIVDKLERPDASDHDPEELADLEAELQADIEASLGLLDWPENGDEFQPGAAAQKASKGRKP